MSEEARCDAAIAGIYGPDAIVKLGRKDRRSRNSEGVPDRLYFCGSRLVFWEVKSANDYLSEAQRIFLSRVIATGGTAGVGNREDLLSLLNASNPRLTGSQQIHEYSSQAARYARRKARDKAPL